CLPLCPYTTLFRSDLKGNEITRRASDDAPFAALAFKILNDPFVGSLTFLRVYSGVMKTGDMVYVSTKDKRERIGRLLQMHASDRSEIKEVHAGDIARSEEHTSELQSREN